MLHEETSRGHAGDDESGGYFEGAPEQALHEVVAGYSRTLVNQSLVVLE